MTYILTLAQFDALYMYLSGLVFFRTVDDKVHVRQAWPNAQVSTFLKQFTTH